LKRDIVWCGSVRVAFSVFCSYPPWVEWYQVLHFDCR